MLGYYTTQNNNRKLVVGYKDFTQDNTNLYEFSNLAISFETSNKHSSTSVENVHHIIDNHRLINDKKAVKNSFWDMFVIDGLIANTDRHLGNWGLVEKDNNISFAPIYDCGSSLAGMLSDDEMKKYLNSPGDFKNIAYNVNSCYRMAGKRIYYHEIFKNPPKELKDAMKRVVPKINMDSIANIIESTETMSDVRKDYLKKSVSMRFEKIIEPSYKKVVKQEKQMAYLRSQGHER